eukprot:CCRYP_006860-RB/>CCRYP_006860-RB protein AED:0.29 eAED:0.29 QI:0/-1/0/1/-1/0/1/0/259
MASAFAPAPVNTVARHHARTVSTATPLRMSDKVFDQEAFIAESKTMRLKHLEEQAMFALKIAVENYGNAVFPNALIAGDVVITHLLHRMGYLQSGQAKVMVVDTFHLFPETMEFLREIEDFYGFKAEVFCAEGVPSGDKAAYDKKYGENLWREDIEQYDKVCKVEPFQRGLKTLKADCMINGRTRWQGFERAWIDQVSCFWCCVSLDVVQCEDMSLFLSEKIGSIAHNIYSFFLVRECPNRWWIGQVQPYCLLDIGGYV